MSKHKRTDQDSAGEEGFVLITVMLVMILLLGLAIVVIDSTVLETNIAINNREYAIAFYRADGVARETIQLMENSKSRFDLIPMYMEGGSKFDFIQNLQPQYSGFKLFSQYTKIDAWNDQAAILRPSQLLNDAANSTGRSAVVYRGPSEDGSQVLGGNMHDFTVYGQKREGRGGSALVTIAVGYRVKM